MIFIDTSAIYALADRNDSNHRLARRRLPAGINQPTDPFKIQGGNLIAPGGKKS